MLPLLPLEVANTFLVWFNTAIAIVPQSFDVFLLTDVKLLCVCICGNIMDISGLDDIMDLKLVLLHNFFLLFVHACLHVT